MKLTSGQEAVFDALAPYDVWRHKPRYCLLKGAAGTGKTTLVSLLIERWQYEHVPMAATALTHKACGVLRNMLLTNGLHVPVTTIHSLLKLIPEKNYETGKTKLLQTSIPYLRSQSLLIVDEGSMVSEEMDEFIKAAAERYCLMVLYIADHNQLPPVVEDDDPLEEDDDTLTLSPIFDREDIEVFELTETVRASGDSPVTTLARQFIESHHLPDESQIISNDKGQIVLSSPVEFMERAKSLVTESTLSGDKNHFILLAYRNETVGHFNEELRAHAYPMSAEPYEPGEHLVMNNGCNAWNDDDTETELYNNEVVTIAKRKQWHAFGLDGYMLTLACGRHCFAPVSTHQLLREIRLCKKESRQSRDWKRFFMLKSQVADLRPMYACTVHKSQSSSYTNVLIDLADIHAGNKQEMLKKLCYTAITRARETVIITGHRALWNSQRAEVARAGHVW